MSARLDPRTKLFMIFVVSAIVMMTATTPLQWALRIAMTLIPVILLILEKRYASALRFFALYVVAILLTFFFLSEESTGVIKSLLTGYCGIIAQFLPALITAWYVVRTTKIDEFMSAMQKMHIPDGITISLAVVMRFFPTIKEEYSSIRDAMKMRGVMFGGGNALKMIEFRLIPLLFSCVNIGDELSAAAVTRGLGGKVKRTSVVELKLNAEDYLLIAAFSLIAAAFIFVKYIKR
ncbi:MAG: energy-coupling factor transporter transmembrane protein EcfT [Lachnospiraceae bacterium]|nr:energy-coupling factor transporter transmembrane protein EcfT [Lachnospiraceae bacterium]